MNRSKLSLRRSLAVVGALFVGTAAALAVASPAMAHKSVVVGEAHCDTRTGEFVVKWTVTVDQTPPDATHFKFDNVYARYYVGGVETAASVPGIVGTPDSDEYPHASDAAVVGTHRVPGNADTVTLSVKVAWNNDYTESEPQSDSLWLQGSCKKETSILPDASAESDCENLVVKLVNGADANTPAEFVVKGSNGFEKVVTVEPGAEPGTVSVPKADAGKVVVTEKGTEDFVKTFAYKDPGTCGEPELLYKATCEGLFFLVANPADGTDIKVTFTPSTGDAVVVELGADEIKEVDFPASEGLTVKVELEGADEQLPPFVYSELLEEECGGGGGGLPVTGPQAGALAGGAGLLVAAGAILFMMARRRRMRFTA